MGNGDSLPSDKSLARLPPLLLKKKVYGTHLFRSEHRIGRLLAVELDLLLDLAVDLGRVNLGAHAQAAEYH